MEQTPVDEALSRGHQHLVDLINQFSAPAREVDEADDVPDDAEDADVAGGADMDLELEGSRSIAEQQRGGAGNAEEQRRVQEAFLAQYLAQVQAAAAAGQAEEDLEGTELGAPGKPCLLLAKWLLAVGAVGETKCGVLFGLLMIAVHSSANSWSGV